MGNSGLFNPEEIFPASIKNVISVGTCDQYGNPSRFNARGDIDVLVAGENIHFLGKVKAGTSCAAPAVDALVLLLKQYAKHVGPPAIENIHDARIL